MTDMKTRSGASQWRALAHPPGTAGQRVGSGAPEPLHDPARSAGQTLETGSNTLAMHARVQVFCACSERAPCAAVAHSSLTKTRWRAGLVSRLEAKQPGLSDRPLLARDLSEHELHRVLGLAKRVAMLAQEARDMTRTWAQALSRRFQSMVALRLTVSTSSSTRGRGPRRTAGFSASSGAEELRSPR